MHRLVQSLALCCAVALLGGCHRHDDTLATPAAATPASTTPASTTPAKAGRGKPAAPLPAATPAAATPAVAATAPAHAASAAKPIAADDDGFRVAAVTVGTAIDAGYAVTAPATRFGADTHTLYASVATTGRTASATLGVRWRYLEGRGTQVNELSQAITTDGPAVTTFEVQNPNRWPIGKYTVEITLDGKPAAQQAFEVTNAR